jgi:hypothetical protein
LNCRRASADGNEVRTPSASAKYKALSIFNVALAKAVRNKAFENFGSSLVENKIQFRRLKHDGNS